jgi:hypothetical protein
MLLITRQAVYVYHDTEVHSCNHFCSGKAVLLCILSVFVALGIRPAMGTRHIAVRGPPDSIQYFSTSSRKWHEME